MLVFKAGMLGHITNLSASWPTSKNAVRAKGHQLRTLLIICQLSSFCPRLERIQPLQVLRIDNLLPRICCTCRSRGASTPAASCNLSIILREAARNLVHAGLYAYLCRQDAHTATG